MKTVKWTDDMIRILRNMYPQDTNARIAGAIGVGTRAVAAKAAELGLEKERDRKRQEAECIIIKRYGSHSQA